jgi:GT2 family glycosyltransferase
LNTKVTVIIPTLAADRALEDCLASLNAQTLAGRDVIVVSNGSPITRPLQAARILNPGRNLGYGGAINLGVSQSDSPYILALNDDTVADPRLLERLVAAMEQRYEIGMCAPQILLDGQNAIDSTGMAIAPDGTSKQRSHGRQPAAGRDPSHALLPSGCAALYRRAMLDETGPFAEEFFLYCEDTDLGLRARWKAWECVYVPEAIVVHKYSHSTGGASALKAYYVERNRIFLVIRNFPLAQLLASPWHTAIRYFWHWRWMHSGRGKAAAYEGTESLALIAFRAWRDGLLALPRLWRERHQIRQGSRLSAKQFAKLLRTYRITSREVASL